MKILTKNDLIIIATIFFAISAVFSSIALSYSIQNLEPIQNKIYFRLSSHLDSNDIDILGALYKINSSVESILDAKIRLMEKYDDSIDTSIEKFNEEIEVLNKEIKKHNRKSLVAFLAGLLFFVLAIMKREKT